MDVTCKGHVDVWRDAFLDLNLECAAGMYLAMCENGCVVHVTCIQQMSKADVCKIWFCMFVSERQPLAIPFVPDLFHFNVVTVKLKMFSNSKLTLVNLILGYITLTFLGLPHLGRMARFRTRKNKKQNKSGEPKEGYTASVDQYVVRAVTGWRLCRPALMLEWQVVWDVDGSTTWEPNYLAGGYSRAIFDFVSAARSLPSSVE